MTRVHGQDQNTKTFTHLQPNTSTSLQVMQCEKKQTEAYWAG